MQENSKKLIMSYAIKLLSRREYSSHMLDRKLNLKFPDFISENKEVIEKLKDLKYVDDRRFAELYIRQRARLSPRGVFLIRMELKRKGIKPADIEMSIKQEDLDEKELCKKAFMKKFKSIRDFSQKEKEKVYRFLFSRGFNYDCISDLLAKND